MCIRDRYRDVFRDVFRDRTDEAVSEDWLLNFENEEPQDEVETQQQEKRGRPCKCQNNEEGKDEKKEEEIEVIPRKRGRPRKCKNDANETSKAHTAEYVSPQIEDVSFAYFASKNIRWQNKI